MCFFFQAEDGIRDVAVTGVQTCALPISMTKNNYLSALYRRIAARRGAKRAIMAVAHALLVIAYHMLRSEEGRVGEKGRFRWAPYHLKKKKKKNDERCKKEEKTRMVEKS